MKKLGILLQSEHAYTRSEVPWRLGEPGKGRLGRLVHYLSGGGLRAFGASIQEDERVYRQRRFLKVMAVVGVVYLLVWWL